MKRDILQAVYYAQKLLRSVSPVDTGNLRENIKVERVNENEYQIKICSPLVDYVVYTNEAWVSPRWKGKKNPNEKWIDNAVELIVSEIAQTLGGTVSFSEPEVQNRRNNKNYWDSPEGQEKLKEYQMNDTE